jgi:pyruvate/2-oxoglutarate/acetoin dehydrogenase E1 component
MATTYLEAIREGIREEMERDPDVFLIGEDIGVYGGAFKVTAGMLDQFGGKRVIDTPIAESAIIGASIGAGLMGLRPVAEIQFSDFITCGFDQIVNFAAKCRYRWALRCPSWCARHPAAVSTAVHSIRKILKRGSSTRRA